MAPQPPQLGTAPLPAAGPGHFGVTITHNGAVQRRFVLSVYVTGARPRRENYKPSVSTVEIPKHRLMPRGGVSMVVDLSEEEPFYWLLSSERFCAACKSMGTGDNARWRVDVSRGASLHASGLDVTYKNYMFPATYAIPGLVEGFKGCFMVPADFGVAYPSTAPNPRAAVVARARHLLAFALEEDDAVPVSKVSKGATRGDVVADAKSADAAAIAPVTHRRGSFGGFARSVASGLGAVGLGAVAAAFAPAATARTDVEDSAQKAESALGLGAVDDDARGLAEAPNAPIASEAARSRSPTARGGENPEVGDVADVDSDDEEERESLRDGRAAFFAKVLEETGVRLHDGWRVSFEWSTKGSDRRRRKRFFSPEGNKFSDATKEIALVVKQRERGNVDAPILVSGAAMPAELASPGAAMASPRRVLAAATTTAPMTAPTPTRTPRRSAGAAGAAPAAAPVPTARASPESKDRDPARNLEALRRKVRQKLSHDLEEGWTVTWEPDVSNGRERDEKVWRDPAAPVSKPARPEGARAFFRDAVKCASAGLVTPAMVGADDFPQSVPEGGTAPRWCPHLWAGLPPLLGITEDAAYEVKRSPQDSALATAFAAVADSDPVKDAGADKLAGYPNQAWYACLLYTSPSPRD